MISKENGNIMIIKLDLGKEVIVNDFIRRSNNNMIWI